MRRKPKTVDDWRERLKQEALGKRGQFKILTREMANSPAFVALSPTGKAFLLAALDKLVFEPSGKKDRKGVKDYTPRYQNGGKVFITNAEMHARGVMGKASIAKARREVWELGFFDVETVGDLFHPGILVVSERWKHYPDGDYKPKDQQRPGACLYPPLERIPRRSEEKNSVQKLNPTGSKIEPKRAMLVQAGG